MRNKIENKIELYYTPEIEEFHVGFEYEVMIPEKSIWSKEVFFLNDSHIDLVKWVNIQDEFTIHKIRVKYLDTEDIESLGWVDGETMGLSGYLFNWRNEDEKFQMYEDREFTQIYNWEDQIIFQGTIKNKSQLKFIMTCLGILE
jgi:hypothetical protein